MKDDKPNFTMNDFFRLGDAVVDILKQYPATTVDELINSMQVYAEWQENALNESLEETL